MISFQNNFIFENAKDLKDWGKNSFLNLVRISQTFPELSENKIGCKFKFIEIIFNFTIKRK